MTPFVHDALTIDAARSVQSSVFQLLWRGKSVDRQPREVLGPYLAAALQLAKESEAALEMRFENLEYFNSATVMAIIKCVQAARAQGVRMSIVYDDALEWQRLSFDPMQVFAGDGMLELHPIRAGEPGAARTESRT